MRQCRSTVMLSTHVVKIFFLYNTYFWCSFTEYVVWWVIKCKNISRGSELKGKYLRTFMLCDCIMWCPLCLRKDFGTPHQRTILDMVKVMDFAVQQGKVCFNQQSFGKNAFHDLVYWYVRSYTFLTPHFDALQNKKMGLIALLPSFTEHVSWPWSCHLIQHTKLNWSVL